MNTWAEVMKAIGALEDRVEELEARIPAPEIRTRTRYLDANGAIVDRTAPSMTETGRILVDPDEYARLERVERAAFSALRSVEACGCGDLAVHGHHLSEALKR